MMLGRSGGVDVARGLWDELLVLYCAAVDVRSWFRVRLCVGGLGSFSPSNLDRWELISRRQ